jgi:hypothetical protein
MNRLAQTFLFQLRDIDRAVWGFLHHTKDTAAVDGCQLLLDLGPSLLKVFDGIQCAPRILVCRSSVGRILLTPNAASFMAVLCVIEPMRSSRPNSP